MVHVWCQNVELCMNKKKKKKMFIRQMTLKKYKLNNMSGLLPLRLKESLAWKPPKYK